ncbi:MAG: hypothetical protein EPO37_02175 [Nitrosarchaeum sp.]|nr:MAG: hypothetical protein EPO37_02175 [Nitrosarchaeum sp.]
MIAIIAGLSIISYPTLLEPIFKDTISCLIHQKPLPSHCINSTPYMIFGSWWGSVGNWWARNSWHLGDNMHYFHPSLPFIRHY